MFVGRVGHRAGTTSVGESERLNPGRSEIDRDIRTARTGSRVDSAGAAGNHLAQATPGQRIVGRDRDSGGDLRGAVDGKRTDAANLILEIGTAAVGKIDIEELKGDVKTEGKVKG